VTCHRCHESTPRLTLSQIHCPQCEREVEALTHPPVRDLPLWRRVSQPKDMTGQTGFVL
jgi:hypothetical protein